MSRVLGASASFDARGLGARRWALGAKGFGILAGLALLVGLSSCDARGSRSVSGPGRPERIVSTMPSTTEMLYRLGVWDRVVGVSIFCDIPAAARDLPSIGSGIDPDLEAILALQPDLVVGTVAQAGYGFVGALEEAGVGVLLVPDTSLDQFYSGLLELGRRLGVPRAGQREVDRIRAELAAIRQRAEGRDRPRVLLVFDHDPIYAAGPDTLVHSLLAVAGGQNVVASGDWVQLDREQVIRLAPEVIFEPSELSEGELQALWAPLSSVPAVRHGRVHALRAHGLSRPGASAPEVAREMAGYLFPDPPPLTPTGQPDEP